MNPRKLVREFNRAGPCIPLGLWVRDTKRFHIYRQWLGGDKYGESERRVAIRTPDHYSRAHVEPCPSCEDHPQTQYPDGYLD